MDKLISMTDFVLQRNEINGEDYYGYEKTAVECINYAKFLKRPLTLGMFVTCDNDGNPYDLEEVFAWKIHKDYSRFHKEELAFFEDAKENILFKGFSIRTENKKQFIGIEGYEIELPLERYKMTIEDLANDWKHIELTPSALKAIGIE